MISCMALQVLEKRMQLKYTVPIFYFDAASGPLFQTYASIPRHVLTKRFQFRDLLSAVFWKIPAYVHHRTSKGSSNAFSPRLFTSFHCEFVLHIFTYLFLNIFLWQADFVLQRAKILLRFLPWSKHCVASNFFLRLCMLKVLLEQLVFFELYSELIYVRR